LIVAALTVLAYRPGVEALAYRPGVEAHA